MILSKFTNKKRRSWSCRLRSGILPHNFMAIVNILFFVSFSKFLTFLNVLNIFVSVELIPCVVFRLLAGRKWKEIQFNDSFIAVFLSFQESFLIYVFHFTRCSSLHLLLMVSMLPMVVLSARHSAKSETRVRELQPRFLKIVWVCSLKSGSIFRVEEFRYDSAGW